jgi:hypothetical protein
MNPKQLTILAILVALVGAVYFVVNQKRESSINREETMKIGDRAVESFEVADVDNLLIQQKGEQVSLTKTGDKWTVAERENYLADATKVRGLLYGIKDMKVAESRSARGEAALRALQLLSPDQSGEGGSGAGTLVKISAGDDARMLVFGGNYDSGGSNARFIKTSSGAVYVVSTVLRNLETDPAAWLEKDFFKVEKSKKITVTHENPEDSFTLVRETEGAPLALEGASEGEELNTSKLGSLSNLLASANFADYVIGEEAKPEKTGLDKAVTATIETFDGFNYVVSVGNKTDDSKYYFSYQVSAEIADPPGPEPEATEEDDAKLTPEERATKAAEKQAREEKRAEHERLTEKLANEQQFVGKIYKLDSWLVEKILSKRSELLMTEEDKKEAEEAAANPAPSPIPGLGGQAPSIVSQGPNGERRVTATTPPVAVDPAILEAERKRQEQAVIEQAKAQENAAAIKQMLDDHKREKAEEAGELDPPQPDAAGEEGEEGGEASEPSTDDGAEGEADKAADPE